MGVFDKIKNALFEEEYVEIEEKPKKSYKSSSMKQRNSHPKEKPIAKKVVLPEKKEKPIVREEEKEIKPPEASSDVSDKALLNEANQFKFPMVEESDLQVEEEQPVQESTPRIVKVYDTNQEEQNYSPREREKMFHREYREQVEKTSAPYGIHGEENNHDYDGFYEKKVEKKGFQPSPIISPIYGVLDKNYKKEEIVAKKEVRLTSHYSRGKLDLDDVRKKAYGTLEDDLVQQEVKSKREEVPEFPVEDTNLLVDLSADTEKPQVKEVTVGDAEEYFQDLGLEYNIDYKDASKERATGRRVKEELPEEEPLPHLERETREERHESIKVSDDDNLFDLIDSMYEEN